MTQLGTMHPEKPAAEILGVSVKTLQRWRLTGQGPTFVKYEQKLVRYPQSALDEYLNRSLKRRSGQTDGQGESR